MLISIIITTKNEEKNIKNLLDSLKNQDFKDFEIILVDNNSTDNTVNIAKDYTQNIYNFGPERSAQRNFGVSKALGEFLLILDADMILEPTVLSELKSELETNPNTKTIIIKEEPVGENFWSKCKKLELEFYSSNPKSSVHAARFIKKDIFLEVGGYDEELTGPEDWDLHERISKKFPNEYFTKSKILHNEGDYGLLRILMKKFYYAKKASKFLNKHNINIKDSRFVYFLRSEFYTYHKLWFKDYKISLGLILMLTLETFYGGIGFLLGKLER